MRAQPTSRRSRSTLQPMPLVALGPVLLARARRHPRDRRRRVGPAAAAERSGDAAFLLADGRVLRRARVHAERPLRPARLLLRLGGSRSRGSCCRRCSCTSRSCFPIARSPWVRTRRRPRGCCRWSTCRRSCSALGRVARHGRRASRRRSRRSLLERIEIAAHRLSRASACSAVSSLMIRALDAAALGDRAAAAALDRLGIVGRRGAVRDALRRAVPLRARAARARSTRPCCSAAFRSRSPRPSSATG